MHIRSFPPALGTMTVLASHRGWWTFSNEAGVKQPFEFFTDEVLLLNELLLRLLLHRSGIGVDLQIVLDHLPMDPVHL
jgi:hypothetical protein